MGEKTNFVRLLQALNIGDGFGLRGLLIGLIGLVALTAVSLSLTSIGILGGQEKDGGVINIAGRQRMLSQKMTKESLAISAGLQDANYREALAKTFTLFDRSHRGLLKGDAEMNLPPTTEKIILDQMMIVDRIWQEFGPNIKTVINEPTASPGFQQALQGILAKNVGLLQEMNKAVGLYEQSTKAKVGFLKKFLVSGALFSLLITVLCWVVVSVNVIAPVRRIREMITSLGQGHLESRLTMKRSDELGQVADTIDAFADNLQHEILTAFQKLAAGDFTFQAQGMIREPLAQANKSLNQLMAQIRVAGDQIAIGAGQVSDSSQALSQGATEQASSLEEISSSMTEMASQTKTSAENASQANSLAEEARAAAGKGNVQMAEMVMAMDEINEAGQSISKIIKVIDEIAFQTNLLALNAAVEAARAGRHGKGFAVVAEEVRNLAARSAKAARETADLIEGSVAKTANGTGIANQTAEALGDIVRSITKVTDLVAEIAAASNEQAQGISEVNVGLNQIDLVTQQNTASAEESAAASEELSGQAGQLREMLNRFRLDSEERGLSGPAGEALSTNPSSM